MWYVGEFMAAVWLPYGCCSLVLVFFCICFCCCCCFVVLFHLYSDRGRRAGGGGVQTGRPSNDNAHIAFIFGLFNISPGVSFHYENVWTDIDAEPIERLSKTDHSLLTDLGPSFNSVKYKVEHMANGIIHKRCWFYRNIFKLCYRMENADFLLYIFVTFDVWG